MHRWIRGLVLMALVGAAVFAPSRAQAKGLLLITYGDAIKDLGELPIEAQREIKTVAHFGYKYSYVGLFWLDFWTWGGEFCLFKDMTFESLSVEQAAKLLDKSPAAIKKPFFYSYPEGLVVVGGLLALFLLIGLLVPAAKPGDAAAPNAAIPGDGSEVIATAVADPAPGA